MGAWPTGYVEFREHGLSKARPRGLRTLASVAGERNVSLGTLKRWFKASNKRAAGSTGTAGLPSGVAAQDPVTTADGTQRVARVVGRCVAPVVRPERPQSKAVQPDVA